MRTFHLLNGSELVGTLREYDLDFPWILCKFEPTSAFSTFKPLFDKDLELSNNASWEDVDRVWAEIDGRLRLVEPDDPELIGKFLLHIENDEAWFRFMTSTESEEI